MEGAFSTLDPGLSNQDLAAAITELAGHMNAANRRWLAMIAEFDRRQGWSDAMTHSCAHWLNWQCGVDLGAAREKVRVANALDGLPKIGAAMGREERQQARRSVSYCFDDEDGSLVLKARLPAESGMQLLKALEAALPELPLPAATDPCLCTASDVSAETSALGRQPRIPTTARRADALALIAESFLAHGAEAMSGGDRLRIVVHVDHETLKDGVAGRSEFDHGPGVSAETSRRLSCDCSYVKITEDEHGEPLNVGRKTRSIPPALRTALKSRDKGCVFPGCTHQKYVDGHHVQHWAQGGETKLGNLVSLCRFHHRLVHEGGVRIERLDDGAWRFIRPDGGALVSTSPGHTKPMQGDWETVVKQHAAHGLHIDPHTARTRWRGESMDYGLAIDVLLAKERWATHLPPETD
jgi:hypothetical protein